MEIDNIEPGYYYHIYNRGVNHEVIMPNSMFYNKFSSCFLKYMPCVIDTLAYCLLPTHFHFLIYIKENAGEDFSRQFGHSCNSFAQWFNKIHVRNGGLLQRPFRRKRITDNDYFRRVVYYIHRNPMHHKITRTPSNYPYSSYHQYLQGISLSSTLIPINKDPVIELFESYGNFIEYHKQNFEVDESIFFDD